MNKLNIKRVHDVTIDLTSKDFKDLLCSLSPELSHILNMDNCIVSFFKSEWDVANEPYSESIGGYLVKIHAYEAESENKRKEDKKDVRGYPGIDGDYYLTNIPAEYEKIFEQLDEILLIGAFVMYPDQEESHDTTCVYINQVEAEKPYNAKQVQMIKNFIESTVTFLSMFSYASKRK